MNESKLKELFKKQKGSPILKMELDLKNVALEKNGAEVYVNGELQANSPINDGLRAHIDKYGEVKKTEIQVGTYTFVDEFNYTIPLDNYDQHNIGDWEITTGVNDITGFTGTENGYIKSYFHYLENSQGSANWKRTEGNLSPASFNVSLETEFQGITGDDELLFRLSAGGINLLMSINWDHTTERYITFGYKGEIKKTYISQIFSGDKLEFKIWGDGSYFYGTVKRNGSTIFSGASNKDLGTSNFSGEIFVTATFFSTQGNDVENRIFWYKENV